jgi:hypothetical protein
MMIKKLEENGEMPLKRSFVIWISNKLGKSLRKRIFQRVEELSNVNVSFRYSETEFLEQDWWLVDTVKFLEWTSMNALLR